MCPALRSAAAAGFAVLVLLLAAPQASALELRFVAASPQLYDTPHDLVLAPDGQRLYVADNDNDRIAILDPVSLELIASFGEDEVSAPHDVAFDAAGRLLVADTGNSRIAIYRVDGAGGTLIDELRGAIRRPEGVAEHPNGRIYATGAGSGNIEAFESGKPVREAGGLAAPHDVAVAPDGTLWVADSGNDRLLRMSPDLEVLQVVEGPDYAFDGPRYFDLDGAGRLYVADKYSHQIKVLDPNGAMILVLGGDESGLGPGLFDRPEGIAIRGADVWFSDTYNDRIVRYRIVE